MGFKNDLIFVKIILSLDYRKTSLNCLLTFVWCMGYRIFALVLTSCSLLCQIFIQTWWIIYLLMLLMFCLIGYRKITNGSSFRMCPSRPVDRCNQRDVWQIRRRSRARLSLFAMVLGEPSRWSPFPACSTARCSLRDQN